MSLARLLPLTLLLLALPAAAQQTGRPATSTVTGSIVDDATGEPLPQATVALYASRDTSFVTGAAADLDGVFRVENVPPGSYQIRVSYVGYQTRRRNDVVLEPGQTLDVGAVRLSAAAAELGEAVVAGQREFVEQQADRTVYNVQEQAVTAGGSAIETLQTLPSLEVDTDGNISLRGNQNVVVQINGRPTPVRGAFLAALLRQIPADKVARVEVIPNPSAKYEPDGMGGIVNIVLAEGTDRGLSGGVTLGGGTQPNGNVGANLSYQRGKWELNGQYGFRYDERTFNRISTFNNLVRGVHTDQTGTNGSDFTSHFFNGSAAYNLSPNATLSTEGSIGLRAGGNYGLTSSVVTYDGSLASLLTDRIANTDSDGLNGDVALIFRNKFPSSTGGGGAAGPGGGPGVRMGGMGFGGPRGGGGTTSDHELAVEGRFTRNVNDNLNLYTDAITGGAVMDLQRQTSDQTNSEASLQVDYTRPLGVAKLELGAKASDQRVGSDQVYERDASGQFVEDPTRTNAFDFDQQIAAAYAQTARPLGPVQVQVGLRAEAAQRGFDLLTELPTPPTGIELTEAATDQSYVSFFPSAFVTLPFGPGSLIKASYSRRINRPPTFFLNPFPSYEDTTLVRMGNPALRPEYTNSFDLTLQYKFFATLTPFFRRSTDVIDQRLIVDPASGIRTFTPLNFDTRDSYGADLTLAGQFLGGNLRGLVSGSAFREVTTDSEIQPTNGLVWNLRTSLQAKLREGTDLQLFMFYRGAREIVDGRQSGSGFGSIGINQRLTDNLRLAANVQDPFATARFQFETANGQAETFQQFRPSLRQVSATLTYTFGSNQRRPQQQPQPQPTDGGFGF